MTPAMRAMEERRTAVERAVRNEQLVELAADGILVHDGKCILAANAAIVRMAGATRVNQLVGRPVEVLLHPPYLKAVGKQLSGSLRDDEFAPAVRDTLYRLDGGEVEVEIRAQVFLEHGRPTAHLVIRDITERLASEAVARNLAAHIQATQKLEAVGALAGGVAHEVNNMLQVITGFSELLLSTPTLTADACSDVKEILNAANHAASITKQLLEFSRSAVHRPQSINLGATVRLLQPIVRRLVGDSRRLEVSTPGSHHVCIDPGQLEQLIVNLVMNARHATTFDDTISVFESEMYVDSSLNDVDGIAIAAGLYATLSISDTGTGMSEATMAHIFEPFFTTKAIGEGSGLGLAAVHGIMAQNGGNITVKSLLGGGTTFTLFFPVVAAENCGVDEIEPPAASNASAHHGKTILVVDDEASIRALAKRILERDGYVVELAHNGLDALAIIQLKGPPALVITDVKMPEMGGQALSLQLRARWPSLQVLFMSGYSLEALGREGLVKRDVVLIEKPFTPAALLAQVNAMLSAQQINRSINVF
ncbi:MAG: response regulator [Gemmatimonadaceae bacterium]